MARTLLSIALVACWGLMPACARIDQSAAVKVEDLKEEKSTSSSCMKSKRMPSRYFAVTVSGQDALIGDHEATYDNETKTISTTTHTRNETVSIVQEMDDDGDEAELYYYVNKTDGYCVYEVDVKSGSLLGVRGDDPSAEVGIVKFAGLDEQLTTRSTESCSHYRVNATQAAYVQEKSDDDDKDFAFATVEGKVDKHNPDVGALQREDSDRTLGYLTATNGTVYLSTDINDAKTGPAGCVFRLSVVDGSVFGVTPEASNNDTTTAANATTPAADTSADPTEGSTNSTEANETGSSSSNTTTTGAEYTGEGTADEGVSGRKGRDADSVETTTGSSSSSNVEDGVATETDGSATTTTTGADNGRTRRLRRWSQ